MTGHAHTISSPGAAAGSRLPFWWQIRWNLAFTFVLLVVIPAAIIGVITSSRVNTMARDQAISQLESVAELKSQEITRWLTDSQSLLSVLMSDELSHSRFLLLASLDIDRAGSLQRTFAEIFRNTVAVHPAFSEFFFYDETGLILTSSNPVQVGKIVTRQPYFAESIKVPYTQPPYYEPGSDQLTMILTRPLVNKGETVGVLAGRLNITTLGVVMGERAGLGESGETYLVSAEANYLLTPSRFPGYPLARAYRSEGIERGLAGDEGVATYVNYRDRKVFGVYRWVPELQSAMLAEVEEAEALSAFRETQVFLMALVAVLAVVAAGLGVLLAARFSGPITVLAGAAARIAGGDLGQRVALRARNELGILAGAFNDMAAQLQDLVESLEQRVADRTRNLFQTLQVGQLATGLIQSEGLIPSVVEYIREQFDLYYVQVYLIDDVGRHAVLEAGTGEVGRALLARRHRLDLSATAIVTRAARTRRPVLVQDTEVSDVHLPNPLLPGTRSEVAIPLVAGDDVIGVLDMQADHPGTFREDNLPVFEAMASQLASALLGARAYDETLQAVDRADAINRRLISAAWEGYLGRLSGGGRVGVHYDLQRVRPLDRDPLEADLPDNGHDRVLVQPVKLRDQTIGRIVIGEEKERDWTPEEQRLIEDVAARLASALEQYRAFDESERRASDLETVAEVSATASTSLDPDSLLRTVANLTKEHFGLYHAHIYLLDEVHEALVLAAGAGTVGDQMVAAGHTIPLRAERSLVARAARARTGIVVNDVQEAPDFLPNPLLPDTRSEMAVPLIAGDALIGVMDVQSERVGRFGEEDVAIHSTLAAQIAVSVQNARLYAEQVDVADQLREVDRLKGEFLASMSHELRTPLNSIIGYAEVLLDGIDGPLTGEMEEDVAAIHESGRHLLNLVNDILDLAKIEAGQMDLTLERIRLHDLVEEMAAASRVLLKGKPVELIVDVPEDLPDVQADLVRLRQIVGNLLANAAKFTDEGSIVLRADIYERDPRWLLVSCADSGIGIASEKLQVIFDRFRQVDQSYSRRAGGTGLGLSITRQLVQMHGGVLWVESTPGAGSTFYFTIPIAAPDKD
ncbi:MAG: GAF domain-containing protein [Anaerolineae bacterium]|nr:GAF domain-containing protein [Anaerolineae bacterium]